MITKYSKFNIIFLEFYFVINISVIYEGTVTLLPHKLRDCNPYIMITFVTLFLMKYLTIKDNNVYTFPLFSIMALIRQVLGV